MYKCDTGRTPLLTHLNYRTWSRDMEYFLLGVGALDLVLGTLPRPATAGKAADEYRIVAAKAVAMIITSCHPYIKAYYINGMLDPVEIWSALKLSLDKTKTRAAMNAAAATVTRFYTLRPTPGGSLLDYYSKLLGLQSELVDFPQAISDDAFCSYLLSSLYLTYQTTIEIINDKEPPLALPEVLRILLEVEAMKNLAKAEASGGNPNTSGTSHVPQVTTSYNPRKSQARFRRNDRDGRYTRQRVSRVQKHSDSRRLKCWYCGKCGHRRADCFKMREDGDGKSNGGVKTYQMALPQHLPL